jgi:hypothetical protein
VRFIPLFLCYITFKLLTVCITALQALPSLRHLIRFERCCRIMGAQSWWRPAIQRLLASDSYRSACIFRSNYWSYSRTYWNITLASCAVVWDVRAAGSNQLRTLTIHWSCQSTYESSLRTSTFTGCQLALYIMIDSMFSIVVLSPEPVTSLLRLVPGNVTRKGTIATDLCKPVPYFHGDGMGILGIWHAATGHHE